MDEEIGNVGSNFSLGAFMGRRKNLGQIYLGFIHLALSSFLWIFWKLAYREIFPNLEHMFECAEIQEAAVALNAP